MKNRPVVLLAGFLIPSACYALGLRIPDQDPKAIARGNAFVATADNPSAIYYNPAGISLGEGHEVSFSTYNILLGSTFEAPNGVRTKTKESLEMVPQLYYTFSSTNMPVSWGLGLYTPYGLGLEWPDHVPFRTVATQGHMVFMTLSPIVAWQVHPTLSIGAGPTISYSRIDLRRGLLAASGLGDEFKFTGDDTDVGYALGLLWQPHPKHSVGVAYRSAQTMDFEGDAYVRFPNNAGSAVQSASARLPLPQQIVAGYSFRPTPKWNLEFDVDWTDWDSLDRVTLRQVPAIEMPFEWTSSFMLNGGVTYQLSESWSVSGGYIYSENSVPTRTFSPAVPDSDRHIFSIGVGRQVGRWNMDAAYQFAYGPWREISNSVNSPGGVDGRYRFISHALALSLGIAF